jgi:hypothetical protein
MWNRLCPCADQAHPEGHYLHEAAGAGGGHGVLLEAAFDLDQAEHHLRVEAGALGLVMDGLEQVEARLRSGMRRAGGSTFPSASRPFPGWTGSCGSGAARSADRGMQCRLHAGRQRFVLLSPGVGCRRQQ